ncbi:MAG: hypothetical protein IJJ67_04035 [Oscillospiraceae bacterium]|nr:hypothetical protein [Oscillospiraceae bacterium]
MKTLLRIFLLLLVAALLVGVFLYVRNTEDADSKRMEELYDRVEPLQQQKDLLLQQKEQLSEDLTKDSRDPSTVQFLFRELNSEIYTDAYPLMRARNIVGVLGVSGDLYEYPDGSYKLSSEQFLRLLRDGWSACYMYSHSYDLDTQIKTNETILTTRSLTKLPPATAIYFSEASDYVPEQMDPILKAHGIDTVILDADDGRSLAVTEVGDIWVTGAMPWSYTGVSDDIEYLARTDGGNLTFTVSFNDLWDQLDFVDHEAQSLYQREQTTDSELAFTAMLDQINSMIVYDDAITQYVHATPSPSPTPQGMKPEDNEFAWIEEIDPQLKSVNITDARSQHSAGNENTALLNQEYDAQIAEIDAQIAELDRQINAIYAEWNKK